MSTPVHDDLLLFTPVPAQRVTVNGWSAEVQRAFVASLARHGVVAAAARSVGRVARSAWRLRTRPGAEAFAEAWDIAVAMARDRAVEAAMARVDAPAEVPVFYRGRQVGMRTVHDNRLLFSALRAVDRQAAASPLTFRDVIAGLVAADSAGPDDIAGIDRPLPPPPAPAPPPFQAMATMRRYAK